MIPSYQDYIARVKRLGTRIPSRFGDTVELLNTQIVSQRGEMLRRDNINYSIGYAEALSLLAGVFDPFAIEAVAPNSQHVLFTLAMAYGPRTSRQIPRLIEKLKADPLTRQAVLFIGKPEDGATNDQPCTTTMQFIQRDGRLHCVVNMRSNDIIKGLPYDLMMFHAMNALVAMCIGAEPAEVTLNAASAHIYMRDYERAAKPSTRLFELMPYNDFADGEPDFEVIRRSAHNQLAAATAWPKALDAKHSVPPLFIESMIA